MASRKSGRIVRGVTTAMSAVVAVVTVILATGDSADAGRYARSDRPFWHVGHLDANLTTACRRSQFNQIHDQRHHIGFTGEEGQGTVGFAKLGWNLRDPSGLARPGITYHFFNDGHSNCTVYIAKD